MKILMALVAVFSVFAMTALVEGKGAAYAPKAPASPTQSKGGANKGGVEGTVDRISGNSFTVVATTSGKEGKPVIWVVKCDANTKFMSGGQRVSPGSAIKSGVHVSVEGGQGGQEVMATTVTIGEAHSKSK